MNKKLIYILIVILGAILMFSGKGLMNNISPYSSILGFVLLMFGLYKISAEWVKDKAEKDDKDF